MLFKRDYYAQRADGSVMVMTAAGMTSDSGGCGSSSSGKFSNGEDEEEEADDDHERDEELKSEVRLGNVPMRMIQMK